MVVFIGCKNNVSTPSLIRHKSSGSQVKRSCYLTFLFTRASLKGHNGVMVVGFKGAGESAFFVYIAFNGHFGLHTVGHIHRVYNVRFCQGTHFHIIAKLFFGKCKHQPLFFFTC